MMVMRLQVRIRRSAWLVVLALLLGDAEIFAQRNRPYIPPPPVRSPGGGGGVVRPPSGMPSRPRPTQPTRPSGPSSTRPTTGSPSGGRPGQPSYTGSTTRATPRRTTPVTTAGATRRTAANASSSNVVRFRQPIPAKNSAQVVAAKAAARARLAQAKASLRTRLLARKGKGGGKGGPPGGGGGDGSGNGGDGGRIAANDNRPQLAAKGSTINAAQQSYAPRDLVEKLAVEEVMSRPGAGVRLRNVTMNDSRWPAKDGWEKMQQVVDRGGRKIVVHYVRNRRTLKVDDFKIVDGR